MTESNYILPKREKLRLVYGLLWENGDLAISELENLAQIKHTTLVRHLDELLKDGWILESGTGNSTGGRRPLLYSINKNKYWIIGIDISRTYTKVALMNLKSEIQQSFNLTMNEKSNPDYVIENIIEGVNAFLINVPLLAVGVGTVGPMKREEGTINPVRFPAEGWNEVPLASMLKKAFNLPVIMESGANCAVLAEHQYGRGKGLRRIAYIHLGVGIRSGVVNQGGLVRSVLDRDDILGHMVVDIDGEPCFCGQYGCLDTFASLAALVKKLEYKLKMGRQLNSLSDTDTFIDNITFYHFLDRVGENDDLVREILLDAAAVLGTGIANYTNFLDLEMIIISGPLVRASKLFYEECIRVIKRKSMSQVLCSTGSLGDDATVIGSGVRCIQEMILGESINEKK